MFCTSVKVISFIIIPVRHSKWAVVAENGVFIVVCTCILNWPCDILVWCCCCLVWGAQLLLRDSHCPRMLTLQGCLTSEVSHSPIMPTIQGFSLSNDIQGCPSYKDACCPMISTIQGFPYPWMPTIQRSTDVHVQGCSLSILKDVNSPNKYKYKYNYK